MEISQNAVISKKKIVIVKEEKPTLRDSGGRFFRGSTSAFKGKKHSEETKRKMRIARKRYFDNPKNRENMSVKMTGKKRSKKSIEKVSNKLRKKWENDKEWAKKRKKQIGEQNQSPRIRAKISKALKGKPKSKTHNRKVSEAIKRKWQDPVYRAKLTGKNAHPWRGGITPLRKRIRNCVKYKEWRKGVMERDNYTCQKCFERGGWKEVDHYPVTFAKILEAYKIDSLEKALNCDKLWDTNNGRTLCRKCHRNY